MLFKQSAGPAFSGESLCTLGQPANKLAPSGKCNLLEGQITSYRRNHKLFLIVLIYKREVQKQGSAFQRQPLSFCSRLGMLSLKFRSAPKFVGLRFWMPLQVMGNLAKCQNCAAL